jgi:hypothetical protein
MTGRLPDGGVSQEQSDVTGASGSGPESQLSSQQPQSGESTADAIAAEAPLATGRPAAGLSFDGGIDRTGDYIEVSGLIFEDDSQPVTLEAWVRPHAPNDAANLFSWLGPRWIALYQSGTHWGVGKLTSNGNAQLRTAVEEVRVGEWIHLAGVFKGNQMAFYINGQQVQTQQGSFSLEPTTGGLYIGGAPIELLHHPADQERWFRGDIRAVRVSQGDPMPYPGGRFTPAEDLTDDPQSLLLYNFDQDTGGTARDESGHGNDGIIHGATWLTE